MLRDNFSYEIASNQFTNIVFYKSTIIVHSFSLSVNYGNIIFSCCFCFCFLGKGEHIQYVKSYHIFNLESCWKNISLGFTNYYILSHRLKEQFEDE